MEFKVKEINKEEKSRVEVEVDLLKKHEEKFEEQEGDTSVGKIDLSDKANSLPEEKSDDETKVEDVEAEKPTAELQEDDVLSYIKNRYDKDINSIDELFAEKEANEELPEDVSVYLKYKQETGRGIKDFYNLQKDFDAMDDDAVLADYYASTEEGLDEIDIQDIIEDKFSFDEELDEPREIKKVKLAKKRELAKAKKFLNGEKDKYNIPLESGGGALSEDQEKNLGAYKSYIEESKSVEEQNRKKQEFFIDKTNNVFNSDFKGFDFKVSDNNLTFKPGTAEELKNVQSNVGNFIGKYLDDSGLITDAVGYHKALSVAMNPDKFAQYFYDQGVANTVDDVSRKSKNINMDVRSNSQSVSKDGMKIRPVSSNDRHENGRGLKIRSVKKH
jgi:hypothetical protein|tara:strand:+ start:6701 stop:7861 length:1161 start_codon:yes stop_codon:yes gene_type:complete